MKNAQLVHVEKGPIGRTLLAFALPVLLSQLLQELYNVTDCMVVGRFGGDFALAAAGLGGTVLSVLINFFIGFSSGVSVITSQHFGAYHYERLKGTLTAVFRLVLIAGTVMALLGLAAADGALGLLKTPAELRPHAALYLRVCLLALPAQLIYNVGTAVLRSFGNTRRPLVFFALSCLCNLGLDLLFVLLLGWGVAGAALATMLSQWLLGLLILRQLFCMDERFALRLRGESISLSKLAGLLKSGVPAGLQALFMSISSLLIQVNINSFGPDAIAGMNLYAKVEGCLYLPTFAYGIALTGFVGQNVGARQPERIRQAVRLSLRLMLALILPLSLLLTAASPWLLRIFTDEEGILANAREAILFNLPVYLIYAWNQVYLGAIKGLGHTGYPMLCTLLCYSVFRVLWCRLLIPVFPTMRVVYLSYDVSFFLMLAMLLPFYTRKLKEVQPLVNKL